MDAIAELNEDELLTVPHETNADQSWCFNVNSLFALWNSNTAGSRKNPWTNLPWTPTQQQVILQRFAQVHLGVPVVTNRTRDVQYMGQFFLNMPNTNVSQRNSLLRRIKYIINFGETGFSSLQQNVEINLPNTIAATVQDKHQELAAQKNDDPIQLETGKIVFSFAIRVRSDALENVINVNRILLRILYQQFEILIGILSIQQSFLQGEEYPIQDGTPGFVATQIAGPQKFLEGLQLQRGHLGEAMFNQNVTDFRRLEI